MKQPLVSFIVPVYNMEQYLPLCIESVIKQTTDEWEMILVDDGSMDQSREICELFASGNSRIKAIHKHNSGQFETRLIGINNASGMYCTGLDADDYIEPDCVEKLSDVVKGKNYDIVVWNIRDTINGDEIAVHKMKRYGAYSRGEFLEYVSVSTDYSFCNKLIKTELLQKSRFGNVPLDLRYAEDHVLICPALCMAESIIAIDETLYNYRQIIESVTHEYSTKRALDYFASTECVLRIYDDYLMASDKLRELELKSLTASACYCLKNAFINRNTDDNDISLIRSHPLFEEISKYERRDNMTTDLIVFMRLFRMKMVWLLELLYGRY